MEARAAKLSKARPAALNGLSNSVMLLLGSTVARAVSFGLSGLACELFTCCRPVDVPNAVLLLVGWTFFGACFCKGSLAARTSMDYATDQNPKRPSLADVKKKYEVRMEFFQDFYKNVKSYKEFKSDEHFQDFLVRKSEAEQRKKEAQERTSILYQQSIEKKTQEEFKKLKENATHKTSIKQAPKQQRKQSPSIKCREPETGRESIASQRNSKVSFFGHLPLHDEFRVSNKSIGMDVLYPGDLGKVIKPPHASVICL